MCVDDDNDDITEIATVGGSIIGPDTHTYVVEKTGARVMLTTSVSMLNNLCASIKSDRYAIVYMGVYMSIFVLHS